MNYRRKIGLNQIRLFIEFHSGGKKRTKDFMTIIIILYSMLIIAGMISLARKSAIVEELSNLVNSLFESFETLYNFQGEKAINFPLPTMNFTMEMEILKYSFFSVIFFILVNSLGNILHMKRIYMMVLLMSLQSILSFIFFEESFPVLVITCSLLSVLFYFIPIGSGSYFSIIEYGSFFTGIYQFSCRQTKFRVFAKFVFRIVFPIFPFLLFMKILVPSISLYVIAITYFAILLLIFMNSSENKVQISLKKIVAFSIIIIATITNQKNMNGSILELVLSICAIFFSLDRVLSAFKDLKNEIKNTSLLYLLEKKAEDTDWLLENKVPFDFDANKTPSELFLLRQLIVCFHLCENEQLIKLADLYLDNYEKNTRFVLQLKYFSLLELETIDFDDRYEYLKNVFDKKQGTIEYLPIVVEYSWLLFFKNKDYEVIAELLSLVWYSLDDESKYLLYYSYNKIGKNKAANSLKNEIGQFDLVEASFFEYETERTESN